MGLIYMRISPSGGKYIGKTIETEIERWRKHCVEAFSSPGNLHYHYIINKAIRKYGGDNFTVQILEDNIPNEQLAIREIYWIDYYKTYYLDNNHGYNMTRGGEGNLKLQIDLNILRDMWLNNVPAKDIMNLFKCGPSSYQYYLNQLNLTKEQKDFRRSMMMKNRVTKKNINKIEQALSLWEDGKTRKDISKILQVNPSTVNNLLINAGLPDDCFQTRRKKIVLQYDLQGNLLKEWPSVTEAAQALNINKTHISSTALGKQKTTHGYIFKYKENNND